MWQGRQMFLFAGFCFLFWLTTSTSRKLPTGGSHGDIEEAITKTISNNNKVKVDFYGESLCPDCQHMVLDILTPMFDNGIAQLMDLHYIAYGNVRGGQCQHGPIECKYNKVINCAQASAPDQEDWFPLVKCLAENMHDLEGKADRCADDAGFDPKETNKCVEGSQGESLEKEAADKTNALDPKHSFVPWIVVNGVAIGGDFEQLDRYVCAAATNIERPKACAELSQRLKSMPSYGSIFG